MNRRRVVEISGTGTLHLKDEEGERSTIILTGSETLTLIQANPQGRCQRCAHDHVQHGDWAWDGDDEFWQSTPCQAGTCPCPEWVSFTPWYVSERKQEVGR